MTTTPDQHRRQTTAAELRVAQAEFHTLLGAVSDDAWRRRSHNPGWTNGEILFHMALGFFLLPTLLPLVRLLGRLPRGASRPFAAGLNLLTGPFNWINALGPRGGARVFRRRSLGRAYDWVIARALRTVEQLPEAEWQRGMYYPTRWDALFREYTTLEAILRYPTAHMRFHADQLAPTRQRTAPTAAGGQAPA